MKSNVYLEHVSKYDAKDLKVTGLDTCDKVVFLAIWLIASMRIVWIALAPVESGAFRATDDAYYYFQVARNIVAGYGPTFDQIGQTNGFHPLWMICLLPIFWIFKDPATAFKVVGIVGSVILGCAFWIAYITVAKQLGRIAALVALGLFLFPYQINHLLNGLETGLLVLLLFLLVYLCTTRDLLGPEHAKRKAARLGVLLGLVFLARLDSIFIVLSVFLIWGLNLWRAAAGEDKITQVWIPIAMAASIIALISLPYFMWNLAAFGHLSPISGSLKMSFPQISLVGYKFKSWHWFFYEMALLANSVMMLCAFAVSNMPVPVRTFLIGDQTRGVLIALWFGNLAHFIFSALFMDWAVYWWHFADFTPLTVFCFACGFEWLRNCLGFRPAICHLGALAVWLLAIGIWIVQEIDLKVHHRPRFEAAKWLKHNTPQDAVIAMHDAGLIAYFSERKVINLDGVINSYEFQEAVARNSLSHYLQKCGVTHFAAYSVPVDAKLFAMPVPARLYKKPGGAIVAGYASPVFQSEVYRDHYLLDTGKPPIRMVIWDSIGFRVFDSWESGMLVSESKPSS